MFSELRVEYFQIVLVLHVLFTPVLYPTEADEEPRFPDSLSAALCLLQPLPCLG